MFSHIRIESHWSKWGSGRSVSESAVKPPTGRNVTSERPEVSSLFIAAVVGLTYYNKVNAQMWKGSHLSPSLLFPQSDE